MIELLLQAERALSVGLLDRAETLYRQVATADPRNSIAVVGLARVALDRGDERAALDLSRQALAIDPENVAAQRMVQRLEEVRAYRGKGTTAEVATPEPGAKASSVAAGGEPAVEPEPEPEPEPAPAPEPEPELEAEPAAAREPEPAPATEAAGLEPEPAPATEATEATVPAPAPPRRRSWLDRLFRRNR